MIRTLKQLALVLGTGYIFVYFSEHLFWARVRPDDSLKNWFSAWIAYSLMAFVFLHLVGRFRIREKWSLFLTAAVFGWLAEGVIVPAAPISLLILPILLSLTYYGLRCHRTVETNDTLITTLRGHIHPLNHLALFALPLTAIAFYAIALSLNLQWHTNWILYLITTPLGFILFGVSLFKKREQKPGFSEKPGF